MSSPDRTGVTGLGGRAQRGGAFPPSCQGRCCPRDQALRLTLTPSPRLWWPRILHVQLLCPDSALFAGKRPAQPLPDGGEAGTPPGG